MKIKNYVFLIGDPPDRFVPDLFPAPDEVLDTLYARKFGISIGELTEEDRQRGRMMWTARALQDGEGFEVYVKYNGRGGGTRYEPNKGS